MKNVKKKLISEFIENIKNKITGEMSDLKRRTVEATVKRQMIVKIQSEFFEKFRPIKERALFLRSNWEKLKPRADRFIGSNVVPAGVSELRAYEVERQQSLRQLLSESDDVRMQSSKLLAELRELEKIRELKIEIYKDAAQEFGFDISDSSEPLASYLEALIRGADELTKTVIKAYNEMAKQVQVGQRKAIESEVEAQALKVMEPITILVLSTDFAKKVDLDFREQKSRQLQGHDFYETYQSGLSLIEVYDWCQNPKSLNSKTFGFGCRLAMTHIRFVKSALVNELTYLATEELESHQISRDKISHFEKLVKENDLESAFQFCDETLHWEAK